MKALAAENERRGLGKNGWKAPEFRVGRSKFREAAADFVHKRIDMRVTEMQNRAALGQQAIPTTLRPPVGKRPPAREREREREGERDHSLPVCFSEMEKPQTETQNHETPLSKMIIE